MQLKALAVAALVCVAHAQEPNPLQQPGSDYPEPGGRAPLYRVRVVARSVKAVNYGTRGIPTRIDFAGTVFSPEARGEATVQSKKGAVKVRAKLKKLPPPHRFGRQYLTYVLWAITPEGRAVNLGELIAGSGGNAKLETATQLQTFALIVTAEPYFAVTHPSDVVVVENRLRADTVGRVQAVDAKYELLRRGDSTLELSAAESRQSENTGAKVSMREYEALVELYQARNAVQLAQAEGASELAAGSWIKARQRLDQAEELYRRNPKDRTIVTLAREATQTAEDARLIAMRKKKAGA